MPELNRGVMQNEVDTNLFLAELTALSRKYNLGITGEKSEPVIFIMEQEDLDFSYVLDSESKLSLA